MREMKDSGIPWIGEIPKEWKVGRIKDYTDIVMGQSPDGDCISSEPIGYPFMQGNAEFTDKYPKPIHYCSNPNKISREGDILMSVRAPVGALNLSDKVYGIGRGLCSIKSVNINQDYLWYYLKKSSVDFDYFGNGSTFSAITVSSLNNFPLVYPTLLEQQRIAEFLDRKCAEVDEMIGLQEQIIEELKAYKLSVITEAVTKGLNPDAPMRESGIEWIGQIPAHWEVSRVGLHYEIILGKMLCDKPIENGFLLPYFCAANVHFEGISTNNLKQMWYNLEELNKYRVCVGDLLVVEGGAGAGGCAMVKYIEENICIQNSIMIVRSKHHCNRFLRYLVESLIKRDYVDFVCNKATIPHFTKDKLANVPYAFPKLTEQQAIADYLDEKCADIDSLIQTKLSKIDSLKEYKKSIIYEYVTGKREVE